MSVNPFDTADKPLAIDLYCGLGGWTEGLLAEGYFKKRFDDATDLDKLDDAADLANGYEWPLILRGDLNNHYTKRHKELSGGG